MLSGTDLEYSIQTGRLGFPGIGLRLLLAASLGDVHPKKNNMVTILNIICPNK